MYGFKSSGKMQTRANQTTNPCVYAVCLLLFLQHKNNDGMRDCGESNTDSTNSFCLDHDGVYSYSCSNCGSAHACRHCSTPTSWPCYIQPASGGAPIKIFNFISIENFVPRYFDKDSTFLGYVFEGTLGTYTIVANPNPNPQ